MQEFEIVCQECSAEFTIITHNEIPESPVACPFCRADLWEPEEGDE